jgi:hypothetical protein
MADSKISQKEKMRRWDEGWSLVVSAQGEEEWLNPAQRNEHEEADRLQHLDYLASREHHQWLEKLRRYCFQQCR